MNLPATLLPSSFVCATGLFGAYAYSHFSKDVPILMYHRVADIPHDRLSVHPEQFDAQLAFLRGHGYHTISIAQLQTHLTTGTPLPKKPVILTFDDGYDNNFTNALPIMKKHGMTGTVFVISDWVGKANDWENYRNKPACRTMSWEQLREWHQSGMEIGSHTVNHPHLSGLSDEDITEELVRSKATIEDKLAIPINSLAYPYGDFDERVRRQVMAAGYNTAIAIYTGVPIWHNDLFALRRNIIASTNSLKAFSSKVSPWHPVLIGLRQLEQRIRIKRRKR
ncbi:MAG TPA: polysaccharide deacetylase family protein [Armatimonadota bacterium]|nr:polysaccharide deacetylase family protein [Armatimonadota bacterium]